MSGIKTPEKPPAYRLVVADELGVLRVVEVPAGPKWDAAAPVSKWGEANKELAVHSLACSATDLQPGTSALVAVGRKGRRVVVLDAYSGEQQASIATAAPANKAAADSKLVVAAVAFVPAADCRPLQLIAGSSDGIISICSVSNSSTDDAGNPSSSASSWRVVKSFSVGNTLSCLAVDSAGSHIAVGGEGMQPSIWQLSTGSKVWQGKGGKPNRVGLVDKPFTTAIAFLPSKVSCSGGGASTPEASQSGSEVPGDSWRFIAGSLNAKLQVYDTAAGRRPQQEVVFGETRITALAVQPGGSRVWAANGTGHMQVLDMCSNKLQDALKGAGGSVRALALHPGGEPLIASVGLDRFVRIHDTGSRANRTRAYLKQQLTAVAWLPVQQAAGAAAAAGAAGQSVASNEALEAGEATGRSKEASKKVRSRAAPMGQEGGAASGKKKRQKK